MNAVLDTFDPGVCRWDPWSPAEVARRLEGVSAPWYVAGGWALDLYLGGQRREHEDIEIAVPARRFEEVRDALAGLELFVVSGGKATPIAPAVKLEATHQTWVRDPAEDVWRLDVFRDPSDGETWIYRRDRSIRLPYDRAIERTPDGIPFGRPEIILLFKAKSPDRARDRDDFATVLPRLEPERRRWLAEALRRVDPGHPWLAELEVTRR